MCLTGEALAALCLIYPSGVVYNGRVLEMRGGIVT